MTDSTNDTATTHTDAAAPRSVRPPGFRLPADTRIAGVMLQVADLARSIVYYDRVIGLRVLRLADGSATLAAHGAAAPLVELRERRGAEPVPRRGRLGLYHFAIRLPDRAALGRFVEHLAAAGEYAGMSDHLVSEAVYLTDPDGLGIEVYADRPRAGWQVDAEGQLVMRTDPLDVPDLVRAAGGEPWSGMPGGTVMGHVHLFVSDLDAAAAFYHAGLGFDKTVWSYPGALFLAAGGYHHHLGTNTWAAQARRAGDDDARLLEWTLVVPDPPAAAAAARSLESAGYPVTPAGDDWLAVDPWGTRIRVASDPRRAAPAAGEAAGQAADQPADQAADTA